MANHMAYHYTSSSIWTFMEAGRFGPSDRLVPYGRLDHNLLGDDALDFAKEKYLFCFLDNLEPDSWKKNPEFPDVWTRIMQHIMHEDFMAMLAKFEVLPEDQSYVVDWAEMERVRPEMTAFSQTLRKVPEDWAKIVDASRKYVHTKVPLAEYKGDYSLPELIIANDIPLDRIGEPEEIFFNFY